MALKKRGPGILIPLKQRVATAVVGGAIKGQKLIVPKRKRGDQVTIPE